MQAPSLDFDWEQGIYRAVRWFWRAVQPPEPPPPAHAAHLSTHKHRLSALARVLAGDSVRVLPSKGVGGVRGEDILVPTSFSVAPTEAENADLYVFRVVLGALLIERGASGSSTLDHLQQVRSLLQDTAEDMPGLADLHRRCAAHALVDRPALDGLSGVALLQERALRDAISGGEPWTDNATTQALEQPLLVPEILLWGRPIQLRIGGAPDSSDTPSAPPPKPESSEAELAVADDLRLLHLKEEDVRELPVHVFEKVETLDNWSGGVRPMDGEDDLDDHLEALEEVDLSDLVRGGEQAQSILKADLCLDIEIPDVQYIQPGEVGLPFPEWDYRIGEYRPDWTTVYPSTIPMGSDLWAQQTATAWHQQIEDLRRQLAHLADTLRPRRRQLDGEALDLDAIIDERAAIHAGHGGNPRLYQRLHRARWNLATTVLVDISLSADGWVDGRRVLDVARAALLVMGEVLSDTTDLRIIAFASHTRNQIRAWDVLSWDEPWTNARRRMPQLRPQGFTRIGPAIRYATDDLVGRQARHKLMILLTDGKPTDYDRYEGRYGVADVRRAVLDARQQGLRVHAFAIDDQARQILPTLFGPGHWTLLPHANALPEALVTLTERMARR